jgi:hypothetical protein
MDNLNIPPQGATYKCQHVTRFLWWRWPCKNNAVEFCRMFCFGVFCAWHIDAHRIKCIETEGATK